MAGHDRRPTQRGNTARTRAAILALAAIAAAGAVGAGKRGAQAAPAGARADAGQATARLWLPIALRGGGFGPAPVALTPAPSPTATASLSGTATAAPTATPTVDATPTPTPRSGYAEPLTDRPPLDDLRDGYAPARWYETLVEVLRRRYPTGHHIVTALDDSRGKAAVWTTGQTGSFDALVRSLELVVHEMDHQLGFQEGFVPSIGRRYFYAVRADLAVTVDVVPTFARSEIAPFVTGPLENMYKATYLTGQSGQQGFFNLLDEFNAYTHSLFTGYGLHDLYPPNQRVSHRDGLVTFMLYLELYLRQARTRHPADYAALRADPAVRDLVQLLWDRANFILDTTEAIPGLALNAAAIEAEMRTAELWGEVGRFVAP